MAETFDPERLLRENAALKRELDRIRASEAKSAERRKKVLKAAGSMVLPMFDRQRVVRSFIALTETVAGFAGPRENWPTRDDVISDAKIFAVSFMRFTVKRRLFMFLFSLLAFSVPALQLYVAMKQNQIIENQNKYFDIQVYDTVTRSITSGDTTAKQITTALLAREDFDLLNGIISQVFTTEATGAYTAQDALRPQPLLLREAAARGHLLAAFTQAVDKRAGEVSSRQLWSDIEPTFKAVMSDAAVRVPFLLRMSDSGDDVSQEAMRYLLNLGSVMRVVWRYGDHSRFFAVSAPYWTAVAQSRARSSTDNAFVTVFVSSMQEVIADLGGKTGEVTEQLARGWQTLRAGTGTTGSNWDTFKHLLEVP